MTDTTTPLQPLKQDLTDRGFLYQYTDEEVFDLYDNGGESLYVGMDPTADSLHLGNFVGFMHALQYMMRGNHLIFLVGGATGMIGDPGGKNSERTFLDEQTLAHNVNAIGAQAARLLDNITAICGKTLTFEVQNNLDFYTDMSFIRFLRDVGKYITINQMMTKETVKHRIANPDASISYTEFSYMLIQGYDFLHFYNNHNCKLQIAGSDQWGNIVTGVELIRKKQGDTAYGITCPLITDSSGKKFGKSEGNALWLDPAKTTPYELYQYFYNQSDDDIASFLKLFTLLSLEEIAAIVAQHQTDTSARYGQSELARYVTRMIHGIDAADAARQTSQLLFGGDAISILETLTPAQAEQITSYIGGATLSPDTSIVDALVQTEIASSKSAARKLIEQNAISINDKKTTDTNTTLATLLSYTPSTPYALLRKGKKTVKLLTVG